jgi:hypothetical protein
MTSGTFLDRRPLSLSETRQGGPAIMGRESLVTLLSFIDHPQGEVALLAPS